MHGRMVNGRRRVTIRGQEQVSSVSMQELGVEDVGCPDLLTVLLIALALSSSQHAGPSQAGPAGVDKLGSLRGISAEEADSSRRRHGGHGQEMQESLAEVRWRVSEEETTPTG